MWYLVEAYVGLIADMRPFVDLDDAVTKAKEVWFKSDPGKTDIKIFNEDGILVWVAEENG